jgi:hypothetical protein
MDRIWAEQEEKFQLVKDKQGECLEDEQCF